MGAAMATRLAGAGHEVRVWNRTGSIAERLAADVPGLRAVEDAADSVAGADVVISMLASGDATVAVLLDDAVVAAVTPEAVVVDHGTSGLEAARRLATELAGAGRRFVDAPVSGSVPTVRAGQLLVMAAGAADGIADAVPVLRSHARTVTRVGDADAGQVMKLAVNLVVHTLNAALGEALALAGRSGIDAAGSTQRRPTTCWRTASSGRPSSATSATRSSTPPPVSR
jgi:3-hydroxyisobutyrate dehydrogenase-like beta-hydroxyacid dehydrogenase